MYLLHKMLDYKHGRCFPSAFPYLFVQSYIFIVAAKCALLNQYTRFVKSNCVVLFCASGV